MSLVMIRIRERMTIVVNLGFRVADDPHSITRKMTGKSIRPQIPVKESVVDSKVISFVYFVF